MSPFEQAVRFYETLSPEDTVTTKGESQITIGFYEPSGLVAELYLSPGETPRLDIYVPRIRALQRAYNTVGHLQRAGLVQDLEIQRSRLRL